jgi:hypothetical protein
MTTDPISHRSDRVSPPSQSSDSYGRTNGRTNEEAQDPGDYLASRNAHENDPESIDTSPAGAPRQARDRQLARTALHAALDHQEKP